MLRSRVESYIVVSSIALLLALVAMISSTSSGSSGGEERGAAASPTAQNSERSSSRRPNVLVVMADDQDARSLSEMPQVHSLLSENGTTFSNAYVAMPQCCPSRASILTGKYPHNHGVLTNEIGWKGFRQKEEKSTVATWLDDAGYRTGYIGKYLNGYDKTHKVPPGWDYWSASVGKNSQYGDEYRVNTNGSVRSYDRRKNGVDTRLFQRRAVSFIEAAGENGASDEPWFLMVAPNAPHSPYYASKSHDGEYRNRQMPRTPSFDETDISDKGQYAGKVESLGGREVKRQNRDWQDSMESLQDVDDLVGGVVGELERTGQLQNTYIIYMSDNGWLFGEHRLRGKTYPYEESVRIPLVVSGPGVGKGRTVDGIASNTDIAPTIARWAGLPDPPTADGRSLSPLLSGDGSGWLRERMLISFVQRNDYRGIIERGGGRYYAYKSGEREYYDLGDDPYQLRNSYETLSEERRRELTAALAGLRGCSGAGCRVAEN